MRRTASIVTTLLAIAVIVLTMSVPVFGQTATGVLRGTAVDASGGVLMV